MTQDVAGAYDAMAAEYDEMLAGDGWMRSVLWSRYAELFRPGDRVLDVGCGTGIDALYLAGRGVRVIGIDISPGMIAGLRKKVAEAGVERLVDARVMGLAEIDSFPPGSFDGITSAFAGLSTTPDLAPFAAGTARLLRPGGRAVVHMLNRFSLWEWLGAVRRGDWAAARDLGKRGEREFLLGGLPIRHYLYHPMEAYERYFRSEFELTGARGLGILRPPHTVQRVPHRIAEDLGRLEATVAMRRPLLHWGRFFLLEMVKRSREEREASSEKLEEEFSSRYSLSTDD